MTFEPEDDEYLEAAGDQSCEKCPGKASEFCRLPAGAGMGPSVGVGSFAMMCLTQHITLVSEAALSIALNPVKIELCHFTPATNQ